MTLTAAFSCSLAAASLSAAAGFRRNKCFPSKFFHSSSTCMPSSLHDHHYHSFLLRVANDADRSEMSSDTATEASYSEADKMVDGMDFGELCNEFECISSPLVESTARQLARDILELREENRALGIFAVSVSYKDPIRSFTGREKYKRRLWATSALDNPSVTVQEMVMLSTSVLSIRWTIRGKPKSVLGGDLILRVTSKFTLNQISGQVIEHEEFWDLSASSASAQAFFWTSRALFAAVESVKDLGDNAKNLSSKISTKKENLEMYPDPSGDPTKFFQRDDSFQQDVYQIALLLAVIYLVVQFLRTTL
ncbi:hypothetical protein AAZX31_09G228500 [Glycine max]|uniref:AT1G65230-like protein n=2 Tax=Glycine subgen. Soja TaxID=1462606 RepID=I1L696_SOYBN|nr:uncharacterized protein LOC100780920 precursor [Glycine max]XP_028247748.1 uncharacterized protein LOC114425155 [Glycine soja]KAG5008195.1 hypothetical protein JHK85_026737 [Glycine max]KAG5013992.1 hypothetical protein JHK86_026253 [Glycine max]KAG5134939.1 hypothetical protein JHK82_026127 [Glycine max]KAH1044683.1 hypothetical protein GYH30_026106 [Glycine max]KAH1234957.1 hypothetical protein GmHk_09G027032 [Glycine max]|eukprot:NP_001242357.2 uncharacterized protein LOC100780920 precursor [Glycine max]